MSRRSGSSSSAIQILILVILAGCGGCGGTSSPTSKAPVWDAHSPGNARAGSGRAQEPLIRVLLMEDATELAVAVPGPYEVRRGDTVLARGPHLRKIRVTTVKGSPARLIIGQLTCQPGTVEIVPRTAGSLRLYFKLPERREFSRLYNGYVRLFVRPTKPRSSGTSSPRSGMDPASPAPAPLTRRERSAFKGGGAMRRVKGDGTAGGAGFTRGAGAGATIDVVNVVPLEDYLPSVLHAELYQNWHIASYRAQAIASRTYALYEMQTVGGRLDYDVRATQASQVYRGLEGVPENPNARRAVRDTRGIVCTWSSPVGEKVFSTYYSSACGGKTQNAANCFDTPSIPPLAGGIKCTYCNIGGRVYRWAPVRMTKHAVTELFVTKFPQHGQLGRIESIHVASQTSDGRPQTLRIVGASGRSVIVKSYAFRLAMGGHRILSNHCKIADLDDAFEFRDGRGFGHGVGLCQWGTEGQARLGRTAAEILAYYYPGSRLRRAY